ncbi:MAG: glycosyltransferase family 4 protein [bacterium]|nr:glycosyltransferase family 4 protein [bacterium]
MRIAQVVPIMMTLPPKKYGGIERDVAELATELGKRGHEVTVFAAKGSKLDSLGVKIIESSPFPTDKDRSQNRKWEINQALQVLSLQNNFDIIHFHYEPIIFRYIIDKSDFNLLEYFTTPFLVSFHNQTYIEKHIEYYKSHKNLWKIPYTFVSRSHRKPLSFLPHTSIVYNGIPIETFEFNNNPKDYLFFLGRITPEKGIVEAIQVAKLSGKKLIIAAKVDAVDKEYYEKKVKPLIDEKQIVYIGEVEHKQKVKLLRNALCLLFPIQWNEPFGIVMVEAMACGTPVIAFARGSVPEVIKDGETGYIVNTTSEMVDAISKINTINRQQCRKWVEKLFNAKSMIDKYEAIYISRINNQVVISRTKPPQVKFCAPSPSPVRGLKCSRKPDF